LVVTLVEPSTLVVVAVAGVRKVGLLVVATQYQLLLLVKPFLTAA
jgi:hypothetical protein